MSKEIASANGLKSYEDFGDYVVFVRKKFMSFPEKTYIVHSQENADRIGVSYVPWREIVYTAKEESLAMDRWVLTDDGYVAQCFRVSKHRNKRNIWHTYIRFSFCKMFYTPSHVLSFKDWANYGKMNRVGRPNNALKAERTWKTRGFVTLYVHQILTGRPNIRQLAKTYVPDPISPRRTVMKLLKNPKVQKMINDELVKILSGSEVNQDYVKGIFLEATQLARSTKNANAMIKAGEALMNLLALQERSRKDSEDGVPNMKALEGIYEVLNAKPEPVVLPEKIESKAFTEKGRKGRKIDPNV